VAKSPECDLLQQNAHAVVLTFPMIIGPVGTTVQLDARPHFFCAEQASRPIYRSYPAHSSKIGGTPFENLQS